MSLKNNFKDYKEKGASVLEKNQVIVFILMVLIIILGIVKIYYNKSQSIPEEQKTMEIIDELTINHFDDDEGSRIFEAVMLANKERSIDSKDSLKLKKINNQLDKELGKKKNKSSFESTSLAFLSFLFIVGCYVIIRKIRKNNLNKRTQ